MSHAEICEKVEIALQDPSFPSIVLLHGPWGCGKTYLTKNHLIDKLTKVHPQKGKSQYISLYGVPTIEDFRDIILSKSVFKNEKITRYLSTAKNVAGNLTKALGDQGGTFGIFNALAKPIKHKLLSELKNMVIIVDDLERSSSEQLINDVLGECLNLAENNTNVWIVVIANEQQIDDKTILEKTFVNRVAITNTPSDIVSFIDEIKPGLLLGEVKKEALSIIPKLGLYNYRIIQRILQRYVVLKNQIERNNRIDAIRALPLVFSSISKICYAHYAHGFSKEEIIKNEGSGYRLLKAYSTSIDLNKEKEKFSEQDIHLAKMLKNSTEHLTDNYVEFCLHGSKLTKQDIEILNLPAKGSLVDKIRTFNLNDMTEKQFSKAIAYTKEYLFTGKSKNLQNWIKILNSYFMLMEFKYITNTKEQDLKKAIELSSSDNFFSLEIDRFIRHTLTPDYTDEDVKALFDDLLPKQKELVAKNEILTLEIKLFKEFPYEDFYHDEKYNNEPYLHQINVTKLIDNIINEWDVTSCVAFGGYIKDRVNKNHPRFDGEHEAVKSLLQQLESKSSEIDFGLKKGKLFELTSSLHDVVKIINRIEEK